MQAFLEYVVKGLVRHPEQVVITPQDQPGGTVYELRLASSDTGRVIGKQGATINAIRSLVQMGSARHGLRCSVELVDDAPPAAATP